MNDYFCGWYFRCQSKYQTIAIIPAIHVSKGICSGSIQIISDVGNWNAALPNERMEMRGGRPYARFGDSRFDETGIRLSLHTDSVSAVGDLRFDTLSPIRYHIMGPFRYVPFMECRHSIVSMRHNVNGRICINGTDYFFSKGVGYIEGDRGCSFPKQYAWTQCHFEGGSLMLSVAEIPLGGLRFTGVVSIVQFQGKEYRLATYLGAKVVKNQDGEIIIRQGHLTLSATLLSKNAYPLQAPVSGAMTRIIRENVSCNARYRLSTKDHTILSFETSRAAFEYEYE